jgi:hypothetical protein
VGGFMPVLNNSIFAQLKIAESTLHGLCTAPSLSAHAADL